MMDVILKVIHFLESLLGKIMIVFRNNNCFYMLSPRPVEKKNDIYIRIQSNINLYLCGQTTEQYMKWKL